MRVDNLSRRVCTIESVHRHLDTPEARCILEISSGVTELHDEYDQAVQ